MDQAAGMDISYITKLSHRSLKKTLHSRCCYCLVKLPVLLFHWTGVKFRIIPAEVNPSVFFRYTVNLVFFFVDKQFNDSGKM